MSETCDIWSLSKSGGCAAKLSPLLLQEITSGLLPKRNDRLLVGMETPDDAAVYRLSPDTALVLTIDFITPVISDPYLYGQVAAANAISDVYAMGGTPIAALNVCCFPGAGVDSPTLGRILEGGLSKIEEAGALLLGGHTVRDDEMKYGLSVTGLVHPKKVTPNAGARAGDALVLTKPVGTGVHISGAKRGLLAPEKLRAVVETMAVLNRAACETMMEFEAKGCTDITGFGLGGHAFGMARASGVTMRLFSDRIPVYPDTRDLLEKCVTTGATPANARNLEGRIRFADELSEPERQLFYDPQTSGGLFIPIRARDAD
ncbi:MAG: selenide, water dikinase SelD, partial [Planctomycetes bacterium]|nr:selenide, water dikinase SelD [Planctomycetota bacterium]